MEHASKFHRSPLPHCLMITNHGMHQWDVIPGLPDTGGQNVYVNQFSQALADQGYRITIVNRGGFVHPVTKKMQTGIHYRDEFQRILYLEDGKNLFIRKEEMASQIPDLSKDLVHKAQQAGEPFDLIISHYWDAAALAEAYLRLTGLNIPHIWIPHSLAAIKRRNMNPQEWSTLHIDERQKIEAEMVTSVQAIGSTSPAITKSLRDDYGYQPPPLDLPPCIDTARFHPHEVHKDDVVWAFLSQHTSLKKDDLQGRRIITEISRTDKTKRKDVLIKAFAEIYRRHLDTLLLVTIADYGDVAEELRTLISALNIQESVLVLGNVKEWLPAIYNLSTMYCTPSVMEGFGMSAQEAAACACPVITSDLVPFAVEYLLGSNIQRDNVCDLQIGEGAVVFPHDSVPSLVCAMDFLLGNPEIAQKMAEKGLEITIPYFTWEKRVVEFLQQVSKKAGEKG